MMKVIDNLIDGILEELEKEEILQECYSGKCPKEAFLDMDYVVSNYEKDRRTEYIRMLTEYSQKETLRLTSKQSKIFKFRNGNNICPCPYHEGDRIVKSPLHRCHIGITRQEILKSVYDEDPGLSIEEMFAKVMEKHRSVQIMLACTMCNKKLESISSITI
ncbi:hypothetical protein N9C10_01585 [Flavobacteriaceae bacterium]|nr:hypothetical protein [Flavobacteriaceae bacterium]